MPPLYVLTDAARQSRYGHAEIAALAIAGGAGIVQYREPRLYEPDGLLVALGTGREVAAVCRAAGVPLVVNNRVDLALALQADGVHLGATDMPVADARRILGEDAIIGASTGSAEQARAAYEAGATYVSFGPMARTESKRNAGPPRAWETLSEVCAAVPIPVYAAGGMTPSLAARAREHGAHGAVVLSAISTAPDPTAAARAFFA